MFRKSQEVWARNFDPKGVNASRKPNPGTLYPPSPACDRVKDHLANFKSPGMIELSVWFNQHDLDSFRKLNKFI